MSQAAARGFAQACEVGGQRNPFQPQGAGTCPPDSTAHSQGQSRTDPASADSQGKAGYADEVIAPARALPESDAITTSVAPGAAGKALRRGTGQTRVNPDGQSRTA